MARAFVLIFAKAPRMGLGKTRLARGIGVARAWRLNRAMQAGTCRVAVDSRWDALLCVAPDRETATRLPGVWPQRLTRKAQGMGDLGARLMRAFAWAGRRPVLAIGTDCPAMTRADLWAAVKALRRADAVAGPATDGGYWLFGLKDPGLAPAAFANVRWSSEHALADTLAGLPTGARVARLRMLSDVDGQACRRSPHRTAPWLLREASPMRELGATVPYQSRPKA
jgi:hypothetical protein